MTDLKWIENDRKFAVICLEQETYFEEPEEQSLIYRYEVTSLPEFRRLLQERLGDALSPTERWEIAKLAFQKKPITFKRTEPEDREISDFIYQL